MMGREHGIRQLCLNHVSCACGYVWRNFKMAGKTEQELLQRAASAYAAHMRAQKSVL